MNWTLIAQRGAVSTFVAVMALALLMAAGLALDGGRKVNALREASHIADNAARAGAQSINRDMLSATGEMSLVPSEVTNRVNQYLESLDHTATATEVTVSSDTVTVTVEITINPVLLPTGPMTVTATETATAITQTPEP